MPSNFASTKCKSGRSGPAGVLHRAGRLCGAWQPTPRDETYEARWVPLDSLDGSPMNSSMRPRVQHYTGHRDHPYIG